MEACYIEFNKNTEKVFDLILTWFSMSENRKCLGRFGVDIKKC